MQRWQIIPQKILKSHQQRNVSMYNYVKASCFRSCIVTLQKTCPTFGRVVETWCNRFVLVCFFHSYFFFLNVVKSRSWGIQKNLFLMPKSRDCNLRRLIKFSILKFVSKSLGHDLENLFFFLLSYVHVHILTMMSNLPVNVLVRFVKMSSHKQPLYHHRGKAPRSLKIRLLLLHNTKLKLYIIERSTEKTLSISPWYLNVTA